MNVTFNVDVRQLSSSIMSDIDGFARRQILGAMSARFKYITVLNFGAAGIDRPNAWPPLSPRYAKRVKRSHATLFLSGDLFRSIKLNVTEDRAQIYTESDYGLAHQFGNGHVPMRGFMPMFPDRFTYYAEQQCIAAGQKALDSMMRGQGPFLIY